MTATVTDKLIAKARELGLPPQTETFLRQADEAMTDAVRRAGDYTVGNRGKISEVLDKAGKAVDERTQGKYADKIVKARAQAEKGLDKLVETAQKAQASAPAGTTTGAAGAAPSAASDSTGSTTASDTTGSATADTTDTTAAVPPKPVWAQATDPEN